MFTINYSGTLGAGGGSQQLALTTASAQSAVLGGAAAAGGFLQGVIVTVSTPSFIRGGANPTVATDGTDPYLAAGVPYRFDGVKPTDKLAIAAVTGTGTAYITPVV